MTRLNNPLSWHIHKSKLSLVSTPPENLAMAFVGVFPWNTARMISGGAWKETEEVTQGHWKGKRPIHKIQKICLRIPSTMDPRSSIIVGLRAPFTLECHFCITGVQLGFPFGLIYVPANLASVWVEDFPTSVGWHLKVYMITYVHTVYVCMHVSTHECGYECNVV